MSEKDNSELTENSAINGAEMQERLSKMLDNDDFGFPVREKRYSFLRSYKYFQPELTKEHQEKIEATKKIIDDEDWLEDDNWQILAVPPDASISAIAEADFGLVGLREDVITQPENDAVKKAILSHERMHLQISSERRQFILKQHREIDDFFHQRIIPDWIKSGKFRLKDDGEYVHDKKWRFLYENWFGPSKVTKEGIESAIDAYFKILKKGAFDMNDKGRIDWHPNPSSSDMWHKMLEKPDINLEEIYQKDPENLVKQICTGYELARYFHDNYRFALGEELKASIFDLNEGFANYVSSEMSGVTLDELQRLHPQDEGKIKLAKKIKEMAVAKGKSYKDAIQKVRSFQSMVEYYRELES